MLTNGEFLAAFSGERKFFLPLPFLWKVTIDGVSAEAITTTVNKANEKWNATEVPNNYTRGGNILVAQEVTIPNDQVVADIAGVDNSGGFLPGYGIRNRTNSIDRQFSINFIETGNDIEHEFIRPWIIAIGIDGLINPQLKSVITVKQYAQDGTFRKGYKYIDAVPTATEGSTLNYAGDIPFYVKSATFIYRNYEKLTE